MNLPDHFPSSLKRFAQTIPEKYSTPGEYLRTDSGVSDDPTINQHNRNPIPLFQSALQYFINGEYESAVQQAQIAKILAPGSPVLSLLPLLVSNNEPQDILHVYQILSKKSGNLDDPLDHILSQLTEAERQGKLRIELREESKSSTPTQPSSEEWISQNSDETDLTDDEDDFSFVTPTYLAILEEQEKYDEALKLMDKALQENPDKLKVFSVIRERILEKKNSTS